MLFCSSPACARSAQEPLFAARVVYDLLFFFVVIIIVLNLIFGVIIDTFADLRSEKQRKEEILKTTCFICGACESEAAQTVREVQVLIQTECPCRAGKGQI